MKLMSMSIFTTGNYIELPQCVDGFHICELFPFLMFTFSKILII